MPISGLINVHHPVLIVDDEPEIVKSLTRDLRRQAVVKAYTDPLEARQTLDEPYSVIISDLKMPGMNGLEFLALCAEQQPDTPRMLLTAFADLAGLEEAVNKAKLHRLMTKPWEPQDLQQSVDQLQRLHERLQENTELRRMALTDALTGVANHRYFWDRMEAEFSRAQRYGRPLSLIMCDVDDFKKYNDEHGHQHGDEVLYKVAQTLEAHKRSTDLVARYGGEEFAVILPEITRPIAQEIAKRHLENVFQNTGISLSLGVASYPDDAKSTTELVDRADKALLKAKGLGKHRVVTALEL